MRPKELQKRLAFWMQFGNLRYSVIYLKKGKDWKEIQQRRLSH